MRRKLITTIIIFLLSLLFTYTAVSKLADYSLFNLQLKQSPFISPYASLLSFIVPASELAVVLLLASERTRLAGFYGAIFLMTLFTCYVAAMLQFSYYLPCSCGGVLESMTWKEHILFNCCFLMIALYGSLLAARQKYNQPLLTDTNEKPVHFLINKL